MTQAADLLIHDRTNDPSARSPEQDYEPANAAASVTGKPCTVASRKAVLVHAGARDSYQFALGLEEAGLLDALVTDLFWSEDAGSGQRLAGKLPGSLLATLRKRSCPGLRPEHVRQVPVAGVGSVLLDRLPWVPFPLKRRAIRSADAMLGRVAGRRAQRRGVGLVSYSYTGFDAFRAYGRGGLLFQVHPHPATMRRLLREELVLHPECASSLNQEWELSLPEKEFEHLVEEPKLATGFLAASSFTRDSLVENGIARERIAVVPYGVDLQRFRPDPGKAASRTGRLELLFVGRINQRKGLAYLLEALRLLRGTNVHLTICGRVLDGLEIFQGFEKQITIRPSVSAAELERAYQNADLFVFPSIGEGFGQVLLESLASGLPVLATSHTAAPDLIEDGVQGFVVEPREPEQLAGRIVWAAEHRDELAEMGRQARVRAEFFTWRRFREASAEAVRQFLAGDDAALSTLGPAKRSIENASRNASRNTAKNTSKEAA